MERQRVKCKPNQSGCWFSIYSALAILYLLIVYLPASILSTMLNSQSLQQESLDFHNPILLFQEGEHQIYWLGMAVPDAFRTNIYLLVHKNEALILDPGNKSFFPDLVEKIKGINPDIKIMGAIFCHQDPDVAGSIADWVNAYTDFQVITSKRTNVLLPHYGITDYNFHDTGEDNNYRFAFSDGYEIQFLDAHFLHFPGAIATYDPKSKFLFSGDVWAAIDIEFKFIVDNMDDHELKMNLFHLDYMSSHVATQGFAQTLQDYTMEAILPQHGAIIPKEYVEEAVAYLQNLRCGLDLIYPDIS
jgi:flavorubredoxin